MAQLTTRAAAAQNFVEQNGWAGAACVTIAGDASNRRYDRLTRPDGASAILMDAPPDRGEDVRAFVNVARFLTDAGLSAPRIFATDDVLGFLLLEDLGDAIFARVLRNDLLREHELYAAATDVVAALSRVTPPPLKKLDSQTASAAMDLAFDWYLTGMTGAPNPSAWRNFQQAFRPLFDPIEHQSTVLIQRDFHAENLLWLPDRHSTARVGLLDFQDAMLGHPAYDMVSFLQDARRDVSPDVVTAMKARFCLNTGIDQPDFDRCFAVLGVQRNLRILGIFARLCMRDSKAQYVDLIPRVWGHIQTNLAHPALAPLRAIIHQSFPEPTPTLLEKLKSQCATHPVP